MATTRTFQSVLNEYLPNELLAEEIIKRDYVLKTVAIVTGKQIGRAHV